MSTELINRITVKKDGVYLSSHSSNDTVPFHSWRCKGLSEVYAAEGQAGLDREVIRMLYGNGEDYFAVCRYLDETHAEIDGVRYAVRDFAGRMERNRISYAPA